MSKILMNTLSFVYIVSVYSLIKAGILLVILIVNYKFASFSKKTCDKEWIQYLLGKEPIFTLNV